VTSESMVKTSVARLKGSRYVLKRSRYVLKGSLPFVRMVLLLGLVVGWMGASVRGQQQSNPTDSESLIRIRAALTQQLVTTGSPSLFGPAVHDEWHVGVFTLLPPNAPGEFIRVRVPIGALVVRAAHSVAASQHRRAEESAHDEVVRALATLQKAPEK
jgi:hypothetical protein